MRTADVWRSSSPEGLEVSLRVSDDGRGIRTENVGAGIRGMRERAIFVGGTLTVGPGADGGAAVRGESFLPGVVSALARSYLDYLDRIRRGEALPATVLTSREDEVIKLMAEGHSSQEIAQRLTISIKTVDRHRSLVPICQSTA